MMKRIFTFTLLMLAFAMNAVAYDDEKIVERHSFRLLYPDDGNVYTGATTQDKFAPKINLGGTLLNSIQTIEQKYNWNSTTTQVSYKSWLHNEDRFLLEPTDNPTAYALDLTNVNQGDIPQGWRCVQEGDEVHEYPNTFSTGARVLTDFHDGGRGLYWRKNIVEYGHQDDYPLSLFKGSYSLTFRMAKRGVNPNGYTLKILRILNDNTTDEVISNSYGNPSTVSDTHGNVDLGSIQEETLTFNIEEAGNYIIRFIANDPDDDRQYHGYILASCQLTRNGASWQITKNARADKGFGLVNVSGSDKGLKILNLEAGDVVRFSYFLNESNSQNTPTFKVGDGCITGRHQSWSDSQVTTLTDGQSINGVYDIFVDSKGDLDINCPSGILIREVTITLAECPRASYKIEPVEGTAGYKYTITGTGILKEKHPALPYITTRFGNDNDMTIVKDFGNGVLAASSIIDPSNNLDIEDGNVKISAHYKKRYQNSFSQYVDYGQVASDYQYDPNKPEYGYDNNPYDSQYNAETEDSIKALAQEEANSLKGREWTVFEATNFWNAGHDWGGRQANSPGNTSNNNSSGSKSLSYKWEDNFDSIYPLYGSYYYFFPSVKGELKVKFYCEGGDEHMPLWMKLDREGNFVGAGDQDSHTKVKVKKSGESEFTSSAFGCNSVLNTNIYEYEAQLERGGVYYLCSNPTLVSREHPVIRLMSYEFIPEFVVSPIYKVVDNGTEDIEEACIIKGGRFNDLTVNKNRQITINGEDNHPEVKFLGNVTGADFAIVDGSEADEQILQITNITYKDDDEKCNKGGAIVVNLHCEAGQAAFVLTVAYSAAEAKMDADNNRKGTAKNNSNHTIEVKKWDFFSGVGDGLDGGWDLGKYVRDDSTRFVAGENNTAWKAKSRLFKEVHKADGLTYDWVMEYLDETDPNNPKEQIFKSVFDMEGDNADMIHETAGLLFHTETYLMGINNENPASSATTFNDRYIGLIGDNHFDVAEHPRSFIIPKLTAGDRIVIKMGRFGNDAQGLPLAHLTITGANDAINQPITGDYVIGGSGVDGNGNITDRSKPYGEYHFISTGGDFELKAVDVPLLKIYSIEIYRNAANNNADILTENEVKGNKNEILYTADVNGNKSSAETIDIQLRYNGKNEPKSYFVPADSVKANYTGTFRSGSGAVTFTSSGDTYTYTPANTEFGAFKARMGVKTTDNAYVTDYADRYMAVGYRETKPYPYTWDFTDLRSYVGNDYLLPELSQPVSEWGSTTTYDYALHLTTDKSPGVLFASGSQLYAGANVFEESAGIGFKRDESLSLSQLKAYDEGLQLLEDGLKLDCPNNNDYRLVIPQVGANAAVYVRATPLPGVSVSSKYSTDGTSASTWTEMATASDGDKIYAYKNDGSDPVDIELWLNHMIIRKIAVSTDEKTVNNFGWNTESRDHAIDPSLTAYMTGKDFRTYIVTDADVEKNTVTLVRIDGGSENPENPEDITADNTDNKLFVPAATINGSVNACIVRYVDKNAPENEQTVNIFNDGKFHLFVPDMHDASAAAATSLTGNLLKARVTATTNSDKVPRDETIERTTYNNYAFTNKHRNVVMGGEWKYDVQAFYRIANGGAGSDGNQAYLSIPGSGTSASRSAEPSNSSAVPQTYDIVFKDWRDLMTEKGDVNGDGMVTRPDIDVLSGYVTARYSNGLFKRMGDMNDDGRIDIVDMTLLIKKIMSE